MLSESIQKGRKGLHNCVLTFLTSAILLKEREKRNKAKSVQSRFFCFLFSLAKKNQVAEKLVLQDQSLPPKP